MMCKHKQVTYSNEYYIDHMILEYKETCSECGSTRYWAYGQYSEWVRNNFIVRIKNKLKSIIKRNKKDDLPF